MLITVETYGGLHACCHPAYGVGDEVSWELAQVRNECGEVAFELDDHGTFDGTGVPVSRVKAKVAAITYRDRPREAGGVEVLTPTEHVPAGTDFDHAWIITTLEVTDPLSLPPVTDWCPEAS